MIGFGLVQRFAQADLDGALISFHGNIHFGISAEREMSDLSLGELLPGEVVPAFAFIRPEPASGNGSGRKVNLTQIFRFVRSE